MFHNYFFLKRLAGSLDKKLKGGTILSCFSQQKDELIIGIGLPDNNDFYIKSTLDNEINLLSFTSQFQRAKKNSIDLFEEMIQQVILSVAVVPFDRSFYFDLSNGQKLLFKLHGNRSNIILLGDKENSIFKTRLKNDYAVTIPSISKDIDTDLKDDHSLESAEKVAGKEVRNYLEEEFDYGSLPVNDKRNVLKELIREIDRNPICILNENKPGISLLNKECRRSYNDPLDASNELFREFVSGFLLSREKEKMINMLTSRIRQSQNYIKKSRSKLDEIKNRRKYDEIANIIMANLHQIPANARKVELYDFYTESQIKIKLNPRLTPQKNAEQYYRKAKNESLESKKILENIRQKEKLIKDLQEEIKTINQIENLREIKKRFNKNTNTTEKTLPYKAFHFQGYEIRVGKNAAANDTLTLRFSSKNDLWLHAKDVAGSHTIIKRDHKSNVPKPVIEYAAGLAAFFSKRKTDTLCPVIVTERKFVRKGKGLPPGQVNVEKEEVIMVPPLRPDVS